MPICASRAKLWLPSLLDVAAQAVMAAGATPRGAAARRPRGGPCRQTSTSNWWEASDQTSREWHESTKPLSVHECLVGISKRRRRAPMTQVGDLSLSGCVDRKTDALPGQALQGHEGRRECGEFGHSCCPIFPTPPTTGRSPAGAGAAVYRAMRVKLSRCGALVVGEAKATGILNAIAKPFGQGRLRKPPGPIRTGETGKDSGGNSAEETLRQAALMQTVQSGTVLSRPRFTEA